MAKIIRTEDLHLRGDKLYHGEERLTGERRCWAYNGTDVCLTREIAPKLGEQLVGSSAARVYAFERRQLAPALALMWRGIRVDAVELTRFLKELGDQIKEQETLFQEAAEEIWGTPLRLEHLKTKCNLKELNAGGASINLQSPQQLTHFFYDMRQDCPDCRNGRHVSEPPKEGQLEPGDKVTLFRPGLGYKPLRTFDKGERRISTNEECVQKLEKKPKSKPFAEKLLKIRDLDGQRRVFKKGVDRDLRIRASFNPAATETGRWSSSLNVWGGGCNFQTVTERARRNFVSDPGMKLCYSDLKNAESFIVAYAAEDEALIAAAESGYLHSRVAQMVWPEEPWGNSDAENDKISREIMHTRNQSKRDMAKRAGHAFNYRMKASTGARNLEIPRAVSEQFQEDYYSAFPGIPRWHAWVQEQLTQKHSLETDFIIPRRRNFYGRPEEESTLREAIAYEPQSTVGDLLNLGLCQVYEELDSLVGGSLEILCQAHDAILWQAPYAEFERLRLRVGELMAIPLTVRGRTFTIPVDHQVGYHWGESHQPGDMGLCDPGSEGDKRNDERREEWWRRLERQSFLNLPH